MNKLAIVYWSGTGNTETMANCIADGARESGAEVAMLSPVRRIGGLSGRKEDRPVRFLRLGRRPMDAGVVQPLRGGGRQPV